MGYEDAEQKVQNQEPPNKIMTFFKVTITVFLIMVILIIVGAKLLGWF